MRFFIFCIFSFALSAFAIDRLPAFSIDEHSITVSGISAGGFMAVQLHVALSSEISGVGVVAGGVYWCSQGNPVLMGAACMTTPWLVNPRNSVQRARREASEQRIDPVSSLSNSRLYIYGSPVDLVMNVNSSYNVAAFYNELVPGIKIKQKHDFYSAHGFPTKGFGAPCVVGGYPWLLNCGFDLAGDMLKHLYPDLRGPQSAKRENLYWFDQSEFASWTSGLATVGQVYIPSSCHQRSCKLHVALHGCGMSPVHIGESFNASAGFNEWAETNNIIVLYPAVASTPLNPGACWDWSGYTGPDFANKLGPQIQAIQKMIRRARGSI